MAFKAVAAPSRIDCADVQGIILRGYGGLPFARFVLLRFPHPDPAIAKPWLESLLPAVMSAAEEPKTLATNIAFTRRGLRAFGLPPDTMAGFPSAFTEGILGVPDPDGGPSHRSRLLGDVDENAPETWAWGGPGEEIDALLLLYGREEPVLDEQLMVRCCFARFLGIWVLGVLEGRTLPGRKEHFGFRDGISQPLLRNANPDTERPGVLDYRPGDITTEPGEFLFGYSDASHSLSRGPVVPAALDPEHALSPAEGSRGALRDLARNGSHLVIRQLAQDVHEFWRYMDRNAYGDPGSRVWLASRVIGRWPSGAPVTLSPECDNPALEDADAFLFAKHDQDGFFCPRGAHIRRANPRDSFLSRDPEKALGFVKQHRLIRRGRPYGRPVTNDLDPAKILLTKANDEDRGLHFLAFNVSFERQFEVVMSSWLNNPKFAGASDERDPLIGTPPTAGGTFAIPGAPAPRQLSGIPRFVQVRGGAYLFMPSLSALRFLARAPSVRA